MENKYLLTEDYNISDNVYSNIDLSDIKINDTYLIKGEDNNIFIISTKGKLNKDELDLYRGVYNRFIESKIREIAHRYIDEVEKQMVNLIDLSDKYHRSEYGNRVTHELYFENDIFLNDKLLGELNIVAKYAKELKMDSRINIDSGQHLNVAIIFNGIFHTLNDTMEAEPLANRINYYGG